MPVWVWIIPALLTFYHIVNLARLAVRRLPKAFLRRATLRSSVWILGIQLAILALMYITHRLGVGLSAGYVLVGLHLVLSIVFAFSTFRTWHRTGPDNDRSPLTDRELPSLSVLVPARNETIDLQNCLQALIASDYPKLEIIALDDRSANQRTPEIIRSFAHAGVRFVQGNEPPRSMLPKNYAYARLAEEASGELLMFIGVDVLVEPDSLRRLVEVLIARNKSMISIMPMRHASESRKLSFFQVMRYWWELGWPRRLFNRPPVLSTLWLITRDALIKHGSFGAVAQMITPEAYFAKKLVKTNEYSFIRSSKTLPVFSSKPPELQLATMIRVRYPQARRRIEQVMIITLFELIFLIAPFVLLPALVIAEAPVFVIAMNIITILALSAMYYLIGIKTRLNNLWLGFLTAPVTFLLDVVVIHLSMFSYEFGKVTWHERQLNRPMVDIANKELPKA